jgi:RNA ligase (TIGR02306 family)
MNEILNDIESTEVLDRENLAVVARVERLEAIPLKDRIELVHLKDVGFTFICEKGHKIGDLVVYIKYDTIVPKNELFEFMKDFKYRVKQKSFTERDEEDNVVKKIYSQGIVLPLRIVDDFYFNHPRKYDEGEDLTITIGVTKYIPPTISSGSSLGMMMKKGDFPTHLLSKTDEDNLASRTKALEELNGKAVYFTLKSEGSSLTCYVDPDLKEFNVCTRNNNLKECEGSKFWEAVNKYNLKELLPEKYPHLAISGECVGPKIQANHHGLTEVDLHVFTIVNILDNRERLCYDEFCKVVNDMGLTKVPTVYTTDCFKYEQGDFPDDQFNPETDVRSNTVWTFERLQKFADIQRYRNGSLAEGIVIRPMECFVSQKLRTLWSGKILNREYKL